MSNQKQLKEEINKLSQQLKKLQEEKEAQEHENKKALLEANTKLDFQTRRADDYEEKYKQTLQYKNQEESLKELDEQLREKQDEIIKLMRNQHEKSQEIQSLLEEADVLKRNVSQLEIDLQQMKEAALNAIVDKDFTITELTDKLEEYQNSQSLNNLKAAIAELQDKNNELQQKIDISKEQFNSIIEGKEEEITELHQKISSLKQKNDERIARLQLQIVNYQKHIEEITAERDHEQNYQQKYYHAEQRLRRAEKKLLQLEQKSLQDRIELEHTVQKLQQENQRLKHESEEIKEARNKVSHYEKLTESIKNSWDEQKEKYEKQVQDGLKKISYLQSEKKILNDNLQMKIQEIERMRFEIDEKGRVTEPALIKPKSSTAIQSPQKISSEDSSGLIEKLKKQNKDLEEANQSLKKKVEEQTKELQQSRQKLIQARGSDGHAEVNKFRVQIQELTSYLKKVECDMLMKKITHAEDENFWSIKQKKYKEQIQNLSKKYRKENSELLQRIDRMKKLIPKDKKSDYYQSGFK